MEAIGNKPDLTTEKLNEQLKRELERATDPESSRYYSLLAAVRRNRFDKKHPGPVDIPVSERLYLMDLAKSKENLEALLNDPGSLNVDPIKMKERWETATTPGGRPPIGGAQDD